jgi:hypothetical protein
VRRSGKPSRSRRMGVMANRFNTVISVTALRSCSGSSCQPTARCMAETREGTVPVCAFGFGATAGQQAGNRLATETAQQGQRVKCLR